MLNHYVTLGVGPAADEVEIKSAYRKAARQVHPDRQGDSERFRAIRAAYEVLGDADQRAAYDQERREWMRQIGAVACPACGHANRIMRRPAANEIVRCWYCKAQLREGGPALFNAQRQALASEAARVVDEVGADLADLASDAVRAGIARLRTRIGLVPKSRLKP